jgi:hypothetical protein
MKVIFLDNDGVICLSTEWGGRFKKQKKWGGRKLSMTPSEIPFEYRFDNFNKKAVKVLNEILEETGAEIVVSSDWRYHASLEELQKYYTDQGIIKGPIGRTKFTHEIDKQKWEKHFRNYAKLEEERSFEIKTYLEEHPEVTSWVAVDDLNMGKFQKEGDLEFEFDWGLDNFVHTKKSNEGIKQSGIKEKILKFLNND